MPCVAPLFSVPAGLEPSANDWTAVELSRLADRLGARGADALAAVPVARRLEVWCDAIAALLDPESSERRRLLPELIGTTRLSAEGLTDALDVVLGGVRGEQARRLANEAANSTRRGLAGVVLAGNLPGLAAQSLLPALLVGRPLLFKSASTEPLFAAALVDALRVRESRLGDAFAAVAFPGTADDLLEAAFAPAERLLAYGGDDAVRALRVRFGDRLVAHGPKASVALVADGVDLLPVARKLARDIALFDQRGCLSVQAIFTTADPSELAGAVAWSLALERGRLPPGPIDPAVAAKVQQLRGEAALAGLDVADLPLDTGTVVVDTRIDFRPSPGLRTVRIHPVAALDAAVTALSPWRGRLQGAALAGAAAWALADQLEALGVSRVAQPGELQLADAGWKNGGIDPLELFRQEPPPRSERERASAEG